ncbi:MAG: hypothetical protein IPJ85_06900 [Flavobacteriales bacterium]|nr:hypothetical protein [Flavobacteriales bacterium]
MRHLIPATLASLLFPSAIMAQLTCATATTIGLGTHTAPAVTGTLPTEICSGPSTPGTAGLWYRFTPSASMTVTVSSNVPGFKRGYTHARLHWRMRCAHLLFRR